MWELRICNQVFDKMPEQNVVSWSAMIVGYAHNGCANGALRIFHGMQVENVNPNKVTILSILSTCADLGALHQDIVNVPKC